FTFDGAEDASFMASTHDSIHFPVAEPAFAGYDLGTLIYAGSVGNLAPAGVSAVTLALFLLTAQMTMQRATAPFVGIDVKVDPFMAHAGPLLLLEMRADLVRTPVQAQKSLDLLPSLPGNARTIGRALPVVRQFIRLIMAVALLPAVAPQFS